MKLVGPCPRVPCTGSLIDREDGDPATCHACNRTTESPPTKAELAAAGIFGGVRPRPLDGGRHEEPRKPQRREVA